MSVQQEYALHSKDLGRIACARCRRLKIKCIFEAGVDGPCKRCLASSSVCEEAKSTRKPKRTSDDRVAQLEETVQSLTSTITRMRELHSPQNKVYSPSEGGQIILPALRDQAASSPMAYASSTTSTTAPVTARSDSNDFDCGGIDELVSSGVLTHSRLPELFERSRSLLANGLCPLQIPVEMTYWEMYKRRPILLQVLITIASSDDTELYAVLGERTKNRLLYEYFMNNTRRLELIQAFLMSCEYFSPKAPSHVWIHHSFGPLATEVALDINLYQSPANREEAFDVLEHERTVLWLFVVHASMLTANRRQPQRVLWTSHHTKCKHLLESGNYRDRQLAKMTAIPRLLMEIQECGEMLQSRALVDSFQTRILNLQSEFGTSPHPSAQIGISSLMLSLHEAHIRNTEVTPDNTDLVISKELCKNAATSILYTTEQLPGDVLGYPSFFLVKPLQCLVQLCKIFRHFNEDDGFAQNYAQRTDQALMQLNIRGSGLAQHLRGKPQMIMRWFKEAEVISSEDAAPQVIQWNNNRRLKSGDVDGSTSDIDFQTFVDMFQISP